MEKMYIDIEELSNLINISITTINRWIKKGKIPTYKVGKSRLFDKKEILEWMKEKKEI